MTRILEVIKKSYRVKPDIIIWFIIFFGIAIRFEQYLFNRALWRDELARAASILTMSYIELLGPLKYDQGVPYGFLVIEKFAVQLFGNNEYALRLFPLVSGIVSIFLFYFIIKKILSTWGILIALSFFVLSQQLIYFSSELKQYSVDVLVLLVLFLIAYPPSQKISLSKILSLILVGCLAVWFSHPAIFVLAGIGLSLLLFNWKEKSYYIKLGLIYITWLLNFAVLYFVSYKKLIGTESQHFAWLEYFAPIPDSMTDVLWYINNFFRIFMDPGGFGATASIASIVFIYGIYYIYKEKKELLLFLVSPVIFALIASSLQTFPFYGRLILFIVPIMYIIISEGLVKVLNLTHLNRLRFGVILTCALFLFPLLNTLQIIRRPITREEIKPVLSFIKGNEQKDDKYYIHRGSLLPFWYYADKYNITSNEKNKFVFGSTSARKDWNLYDDEITMLEGNKRVWILFTHFGADDIGARKYIMHQLTKKGRRLVSFFSEGAEAHLFDLTNQSLKNDLSAK